MPYEPTLKKNPQQLTVEQHFHTAHAIAKFYGADGKVEVKILKTGETVRLHKRAKIFCAKRSWDEKAERGFMPRIEAAFHEEIDNIKPFNERNHTAISEYFILWCLRFNLHSSSMEDVLLKGVAGSEDITKEKEEILEKKGYVFVRKNGVLPSRFFSSIKITMERDRYWPEYKDAKWGLLEAVEGEFLVADSYQGFTFIPFTPKLAFAADYDDMKISKIDVAKLNRDSISKATCFYFGKDLNHCPI